MGAMMNEQNLADILLQKWDPIGILDEPLAHDEYQHYVATLVSLLNTNASTEMIASKLLEIEQTEMGLTGDVKRANRVAALLKSLISANH